MFYALIQEVKAQGTSQRKPKACTDVQMLPSRDGGSASVSLRFIHLLCTGVSPTQSGYFACFSCTHLFHPLEKDKKAKTSVLF